MHLGHTYSAFGHGATAIIFFLFSFFFIEIASSSLSTLAIPPLRGG